MNTKKTNELTYEIFQTKTKGEFSYKIRENPQGSTAFKILTVVWQGN